MGHKRANWRLRAGAKCADSHHPAHAWVKVPEIPNTKIPLFWYGKQLFPYTLHRMKNLLNTKVSINTENFHPCIWAFYSIQRLCLQKAKALIILCKCAGCIGWSGSSLSTYAWKQVFAWCGQNDDDEDLCSSQNDDDDDLVFEVFQHFLSHIETR